MTSTMRIDPVTASVEAMRDRLGPGLYGVACSGGADSLALAHALIHVAGAAHVVVISIDHGLRAGSAEVAASVARWATEQGAAGVVRRVHVAPRASVEAAAREARYAALDAIAEELGLVAVMLGHTARDQAETVLMRIIRGTGPAGLAAIPSIRATATTVFLRPLLGLPRETIDSYAADHQLPVVSDPMNADLGLARVRVRMEILPALRVENPQLDAALLRLAASAQEWLEVIDGQARAFARFPIGCTALARQPAAIRKRALSLALEAAGLDHDASHLEELDQLVTRPAHGTLAIDLPGAQIVRCYDALAPAGGQPADGSADGALAPPPGPYVLRRWEPGDRMRPDRLQGRSRKLSDLFIDAKVPRDLRSTARVLVCTTDASIVWAEHLGLAFGAAEILRPKPP